VALVVVCAVAAVIAVRRHRDWRSLWAPALAPVGLLAFAGYLWARTGSPTTWMHAERSAWNDRIDLGWAALSRVGHLVTSPHLGLGSRDLNDLVGTLGLAFLVVALVLLRRWRPPAPVAVYGVLAVATAVMSNHVGPRPRFLLAAFPLVVAVAVGVRGRAFAAVVAVSTVLLVVLSALVFATTAATP
jgi:hypothetical protein